MPAEWAAHALGRVTPPGRSWRVSRGVPGDAVLVRVAVDARHDLIEFAHPTFEPVPEGAVVPPFGTEYQSADAPGAA